MSGGELADILRARVPELKVLFTSGYPGDTIARHGASDAGVSFLPKPFMPADVARKVREALDALTRAEP